MAKKQEVRWHKSYLINGVPWVAVYKLTEAAGWVMVRYKGRQPFLVRKVEWDSWERTDPAAPAEK